MSDYIPLTTEDKDILNQILADDILDDFIPQNSDFSKNEAEFDPNYIDEEQDADIVGLMASVGPIGLQAALDAQGGDVLSVREKSGRNDGVYVEIYLKAVGLDKGNPWCQAFTIFRLIKASKKLNLSIPPSLPMSGYTPTVANWFKKNKLWIPVQVGYKNHTMIQPGDHVWFYFSSKKRVAHTGIVVKVEKTGVWVVEGNTGPDKGRTVERDGQGVFLKFRTWGSIGTKGGFGRPNF